MVADARDARRRLARLERHLRIAALAHRLMPLDVYYRTPGLYCELVEGWAA